MPENNKNTEESGLLTPLTTFKAIHIIVIIGLLVFGNALFNGFVWDDLSYILNNPETHTFSLTNIFQGNTFNLGGQYRPFAAFYYSIMYGVFKDVAFFYHLFSIVLHILNSVLVFIVFKKFFDKYISLFLALIFLVHPMQVESATFVSTAGGNFFFLFGLIGFILGMKKQVNLKKTLIIAFTFLFSLLSKETGILFLVMSFYHSLLYNKKHIFLVSALGTLVLLIYMALRFGIGEIGIATQSTIVPIVRLSFEQRLINVPEIFYYYIVTFFFPQNLAVMQNWVYTQITIQNFYMPLLIGLSFIAICFVAGWYLYKKDREKFTIYTFFSVWFALGMLMHLQLFPLNMTVADRWFYFPMVGLLGVIGVGIQKIGLKIENKNIIIILAVIILLMLSVRTMVRNNDWYNGITLYTHDRELYANHDIETNLGGEYIRIKKYDEALKHYFIADELFSSSRSLYNIGYAYEEKKDVNKAKMYYYKALNSQHYSRITQDQFLVIYQRLAWVLLKENDLVNAGKIIKKAFSEYPNSGTLWYLQAIYEYKSGDKEAALKSADKARTLTPTIFTKSLYIKIVNNDPIGMD